MDEERIARAKSLMMCANCGEPIVGFEDPGGSWPEWEETGECQQCQDISDEVEDFAQEIKDL